MAHTTSTLLPLLSNKSGCLVRALGHRCLQGQQPRGCWGENSSNQLPLTLPAEDAHFLRNKTKRPVICSVSLWVVSRNTSSTCLPAGEGEDDDVIEGPGVVLVRGIEHQLVRGFLPEVNQECGVDHGNRKAAHPLPFSDLKVVRGPFIEALGKSKQGGCVL